MKYKKHSNHKMNFIISYTSRMKVLEGSWISELKSRNLDLDNLFIEIASKNWYELKGMKKENKTFWIMRLFMRDFNIIFRFVKACYQMYNKIFDTDLIHLIIWRQSIEYDSLKIISSKVYYKVVKCLAIWIWFVRLHNLRTLIIQSCRCRSIVKWG